MDVELYRSVSDFDRRMQIADVLSVILPAPDYRTIDDCAMLDTGSPEAGVIGTTDPGMPALTETFAGQLDVHLLPEYNCAGPEYMPKLVELRRRSAEVIEMIPILFMDGLITRAQYEGALSEFKLKPSQASVSDRVLQNITIFRPPPKQMRGQGSFDALWQRNTA